MDLSEESMKPYTPYHRLEMVVTGSVTEDW